MHLNDLLPDIASNTLSDNSLPLTWVGMEKIAVPITFELEDGKLQTQVSQTDIYVSLDKPQTKGIHMSRLHGILNRFADAQCSKETLDLYMNEAVTSQAGISNNAKINLAFDLLLKKPALLSEENGYQTYPVAIKGEMQNGVCSYDIEMTIPYSSTCPCSASLSRQLQAKAIEKQFPTDSIDKDTLLAWLQSEQGSIATPHSQRSYAYIKMTLGNNNWPEFSSLIHQFEDVIGTPVQTAVKRIDEQEFARLNATNLMFCEDAARRLKNFLEQIPSVTDYWFKVEHQESLHAHNAVVIDQKVAEKQ